MIKVLNVEITDEEVEFLAHSVHEGNRAWCLRNGDQSQPEWSLAPDWQRTSCLNGVRFHLARLDEPSNPAASHNSWSAEKLADGWKYGPVKDPAKKEHPCLVPFEELPPEQQFKDVLFETLVREITAKLIHTKSLKCFSKA